MWLVTQGLDGRGGPWGRAGESEAGDRWEFEASLVYIQLHWGYKVRPRIQQTQIKIKTKQLPQ